MARTNSLETFRWRGRDWELETFFDEGQKRYKCRHGDYENYVVEEVLRHMELEHRHHIYREAQRWEVLKFWRRGERVYKCLACAFASSKPSEVADHCATSHQTPSVTLNPLQPS